MGKVVAVTGASGLVGRALSGRLIEGGHTVLPLVRGSSDRTGILWDPRKGVLEPEKLDGVDTVVHLAGEPVAGLWTARKKQAIRDSRAIGTRMLAESLAKLPRKPEALICASAVGYYGSRGEELLDETSPSGTGFLPEVCREWEAAADPARAAGMRVTHLRLGIVLTPAGGALKAMLPAFKLGVAGVLGSGGQWLPWVGLDDVVSVFHTAVMDGSMSGVVNVTAPGPVTNHTFTKSLGRVLRRPTVLAVPAFVLRLAGRMGEEMLLSSQRVVPARLMREGFAFRDTDLEAMLRRVLGNKKRPFGAAAI